MVEKLESFKINTHTFSIEKVDNHDLPFFVRHTGCKIAERKTMAEARDSVHSYALCQLSAEIAGYKRQHNAALKAYNSLYNDPFYLAKFLV